MNLKSILLLTIFLLSHKIFLAQTPFPYQKTWKKIDSLIREKGLPRSALQELNKLHAAAIKEKQEAQWVKSVIYLYELRRNDNDDLAVTAKQLETETDAAPPRVAALLQSLEAENLHRYAQSDRVWVTDMASKLSASASDSSAEVNTGDPENLNAKIRSLYLASLRDEQLLLQTSLRSFEPVIQKGNARFLRPTLYDLLAYRALDYFENSDPGRPLAEDAFRMDDPAVFLPAAAFSAHIFAATDSSSNQLTALTLFQNLLRAHAKDAIPDAEIDADISRIQFAARYAVLPGKDSLYFSALQRITDRYPSGPASARAWYLQAAYFAERAAEYNPLTDTAHRFDYRKARAICEQVIGEPDSSEGKTECSILLGNITRETFHVITENANLPDLPFRASVAYKNVWHLYGRIIRIDNATRDAIGNNDWDGQLWETLLHLPVLKKFDQTLPETHDYQEHRVEIKLDALPPGQYALFTSSSPSFDSAAVLAVQYFFCSSIAFVHYGQDYFVADRNSGEPLAGVTVQSFYPVYVAARQRDDFRKGRQYTTDQHGYFRLLNDKTNGYQNRLEFRHGKDFLSYTGRNWAGHNNTDDLTEQMEKEAEKKMRKYILFTDRAIYRPEQTVYYKGLSLTQDFHTKRYKIFRDAGSILYLLDANDQPLDSAVVSPDAFGSFHGSFRLPAGLLNGEFSIREKETEDSRDFSVEEYKRPQFYVVYDPVKGSYAIGDSVRISGSALSYAGNTLAGAKVSYRVFRESRFPYPWFFPRTPSSSEQEIRHGETTTDAAGAFDIRFPALADPQIKKESGPVFTFRIETDVTADNGETRSAGTSVAASYQAFQIVSPLPKESRVLRDSLRRIAVSTQNAAGIFIPERLTVTMYKLKAPDHLIRKRYWEQPDQFVLSAQTYAALFPFDEYRNETSKESWPREKLVERTDSSRADGLFAIFPDEKNGTGRLPAGWYLVEFSARDGNGERITDKRYIELLGSAERQPADPTYNAIVSAEATAEPGNTVTIQTGSSVAGDVIRSRRGLEDSLTSYSFYKLNNEIRSFTLKIEEKDRGGFAVNDVFIRNNRWYSSTHIIQVPWTNKELQISYLSWRDKLLPGSRERWTINIRGDKGGQVAAEVLTAMYDASLDQFKTQSWEKPDIYPVFYLRDNWTGAGNFDPQGSSDRPLPDTAAQLFFRRQDQLVTARQPFRLVIRGQASVMRFSPGAAPMPEEQNKMRKPAASMVMDELSYNRVKPPEKNGLADSVTVEQKPEVPVPGGIRKNFNETAFFLPDLNTDSAGNTSFSFTMPEALTRWKWMIFAHSKDLSFGYSEKQVVTQKDLMLQPNMPRFFREGDSMVLPVRISNLTAAPMTGSVRLDWLDAGGNGTRHLALGDTAASRRFAAGAGQSTVVFFPVIVPDHFQQPVVYRLQATTDTGTASDGEEGMIPVMSNRILLTETFPLNLSGGADHAFSWEKLLNSGNSSSLKNQSLTVEYAGNPAWYAIQSLPYLMEFPYACAEQTFNRFYANALAAQTVARIPGIRAVFDKWMQADTTALLSNLEKNPELKSVLLRETPWVLAAADEHRQKRNLALLFDQSKINAALKASLDKLKPMQSASGGFPWFAGGPDDRYITQYILSGIGHLKKLSALPGETLTDWDGIVRSALAFLDRALKSDYDRRPKKGGDALSASQVQYLYMRSFFPERGLPGSVFPAMNYYRKLAIRDWTKQNMYLRGMIALFLYRTGDRQAAGDIMRSIKENATQSDALGVYWKPAGPGYYWQESSLATQSLLVEAFSEISPDQQWIDQMKYWLLRQKQTSSWGNTKSTADACYALLLNGSNWLASDQRAEIRLGTYLLPASGEETEAGTGYTKKVIPGKDIRPEMGNIRVSVHPQNNGPVTPSWGALYWQYFENLDRVSAASSPLAISKSVYILSNTTRGPSLAPLTSGTTVKPGTQLMVRIVLKAERDMDYVHLKDMRAACLEPKNVLSGYHWDQGLGYYETTTDQSTSFFFDHLPRGTHTIEYPVFVGTAGDYSNGISTLECMYAPEFAAHTAGTRIRVTEK